MSSSICRACGAVGVFLVLVAGPLPCGVGASAADLAVYGESLAAGWENWSWNTTAVFSTSPVHGGTRSLAVTYTGGWAGLYLALNTPVSTGSYDTLQFWIHGGAQGGQALQVVLADGTHALLTDQAVAVSATAGAWTQVKVPLADLGNPALIGGIVWQDTTGAAQPTFYLDDVSFITQGIVPPPPPPPGTGPALRINAAAGRHAIREGIYGMNFAAEALAAELKLPVRRWGGNSTTRYNWQTSMINVGSDWYFENLQEGTVNVAALPNGSASDQFVEQDRRTETKTLITVPLIGWTPKSTSPRSHPYDCAFKVSKYGAQQSTDSWDLNCGNGRHADNSPIVGNDPADTSMEIGPDFVTAWVNHLIGKYGTAAHGGVAYYNLDNEPMLWNSTHRDVHPLPATYDELRDRTYQYGAAVKAADPTAKTLGPVLWGWCAYFYSALDGCSNGSDYQAHGSTPFLAWYLQQMKTYEQQHGTRILDFLDLHYYPQANGVALSSAGGAATQALRLRSTRSLWDPSYLDESWISDTAPGGVAVRLIPRMKEWVAANYPGTALAITEYNWGALDHINGALAQADVLGIFGREGLDLATLWGPPTATQPGAFAFRMYRNYDGTGQGFGDVGVDAASDDQSSVAVYAAQRGSGNALTVIVINKTATSLTSRVNLSGFVPTSTAAVYRYSAANTSSIEHLPDQPLTESGFDVTLTANSITLFVLTPSAASPAHAAGVGVFRGGAWYVDGNHNQAWDGCGTDGCYVLGMTGDTHVVGDWNGSGTTKIGVYRSATGVWYLDTNGNGIWDGCGVDTCANWGGDPTDVPVVGDWNASGTTKIGVYRQATGYWYLDTNGNGTWDGCGADQCIPWGGDPSDIPVVGAWSGTSPTKIGVYRQATGYWYLDTNGNGTWDGCGTDQCIPWGGDPTDLPVVGDWDGSGPAKIGVYRTSTGTWYLDQNGNGAWNGCATDKCIPWGGDPTDVPVVGDWTGSGTTKIGVYRTATGYWYLDTNGNGVWDGCTTDYCLAWGGDPADAPVVGKW